MNELSPILVSMLNAILVIALPALAVAAAAALSVWAKKTWEQYKLDQPTIAEQVAYYVRIAVQAAEQAGASKLADDKKVYALKVARLWLNQMGLQNIQLELIEAEIERQVREMNKELAV